MEFVWLLCAVLSFLSCSEADIWVKGHCTKIADGYACSDLALQFVPDEIPDSTKTLDFSFNYLTALYNTTFQRLTSLILLDLTRCSITFIYDDIFQQQPDLETLILVGNPLVFIADSAFSGPVALKHLSLAQSAISDLADIPSTNLDVLEVLDVRGCHIRSLHALSKFHFPKMKKLILDLNSIQKIGAADLVGLQQIHGIELSFKGNDLVDIEPNAFQLLNTGSLDFTGCLNNVNISVLLRGLEGVKTEKLHLGLYEDSAKGYVKQAWLQSFCNISVVDLDFQLQHFPDLTDTAFQCLSELRKLDLTRAHLSFFPTEMTKLTKLSYLVLDENGFSDVCKINAGNFPMLTHLSICGNREYLNFQESCLKALIHLEELQLGHSSLKTGQSCCNKQLSGLTELKLLNISFNFPMNWESLPFNSTPHLIHLDCSHVDYNLSSSSPFSNLQNLHTLNLSSSVTNFSNVHLLKGLKNLRVLNLKGNPLHGGILANAENFKHVPLLESLILSACSITGIGQNVFKGFTNLRYVDLSENQLVMLSVAEFYSLNEIQLNFARNAIAKVDVKSVEKLGENSTIDLSYNPLLCNCTNYQFINWVKGNVHKMEHLQETVCDNTKQITEVDLQCESSNETLVWVLSLAIFVAILIPTVKFFWKKIRISVDYSVL